MGCVPQKMIKIKKRYTRKTPDTQLSVARKHRERGEKGQVYREESVTRKRSGKLNRSISSVATTKKIMSYYLRRKREFDQISCLRQ